MVEATRSKLLAGLAMTVKEALEIIQRCRPRTLKQSSEIVFRQSWEDCSEIAKSSGYEVGYIRDVGSMAVTQRHWEEDQQK